MAFFKLVGHLIATAAKVVYHVLKFLRVRLLALWLFVSAILALCGVFKDIGIAWFWIVAGICTVFTLMSWIIAIHRFLARKRVPRDNGSGGEGGAPAEEGQSTQPTRPQGQEGPAPQMQTQTQTAQERPAPARYPRWFNVAGNPDYFFAEYEDRYELYYRGKQGAEYVRTDYKEQTN